MSEASGVQLTGIERKNILKTAEQLCKSTHCKSLQDLGRVLLGHGPISIPVTLATPSSPTHFLSGGTPLPFSAVPNGFILCASLHTPVSQTEVVQLLTKYCEMTRDRIDRVMFRDLLHDHFDMSDDFFMDRGPLPVKYLLL